MNGMEIKQWRIKRGWSLKVAAKQLGLPVSKIIELEETGKLSAQDKRLCIVLMVGIAAIAMHEGVVERHRKIVQKIKADNLKLSGSSEV